MNKIYPIYNFDHFDESIEENNSAFSVLSKKSKKIAIEQEEDCWFSGVSQMKIEDILRYCWDKEDVDNFIEEYPECSTETFKIYDESHKFSYINYINYCPIQEKRENLINQIITK
jgi:hypothetical protein